jgi:hypothetical protein
MWEAPRSRRLLAVVSRRLQGRSLLEAVYWSVATAYGVYGLALLTRRLTGLIPDWFGWQTFALVPVVACLAAWVIHRRPALQEAARAVDRSAGVKDLYLTLSLLDRSAGEYQPLVVQAAEDVADRIDPRQVVSFSWQRRYGHLAWLPLAIACALVWLPQGDPFGKVASAALAAQRKERLAETRKQTRLRLAEVKKDLEEQAADNPVDESIEQLKLTLNQFDPSRKSDNLRVLSENQKMLGEQWRKLAGEKLKNALKSSEQTRQGLGADDEDKLRKWTRELQAGSADSLRQELAEQKELLQRLAKTGDPVEKQQLQKELRDRLKDVEQLARQHLDAQPLAASLQRALKQLELTNLQELSQEALDAAMDSLELSEMELEQLAQSAEDLRQLEEALKTLQLAKRLNEYEKLDGKQCRNCKTMAEYQALYKKLLAECQAEGLAENEQGQQKRGQGLKGRGIGEGGIAPEDDSVQTEFRSELAQSAVQAGKTILSLKSRGLGEKGQALQDYRHLLQQVRQGVGEAILQEQVPPGYHEGIKTYFDSLESMSPPK